MSETPDDILRVQQLSRAIGRWQALPDRPRRGAREVLAAAKTRADLNLAGAMARALSGQSAGPLPDSIHAVLIKPVSDHCNLRCSYCYEGEGGKRFQPGRMSEDLLKRTIREACEQAPGGKIQFLWHGGEPLLAGRTFFESGFAQQEIERTRLGLSIRNSVQTNATLLDDNWLDLLADHSVAIGVSLDGPADLHDARRKDAAGCGTHACVIDALERLRCRGLEFGVIAVIGRDHVPHAARTLAHFHELGVRNLDLHPDVGGVMPGAGGGSLGLSPSEYASFMTDAFDTWLAIGDPGFRINLFEDFLRGWFGARPHTCYFNGSCGAIVAIESNGDVVPCTRPFERHENTFGNLGLHSLTQIASGPGLTDFRRRDAEAITRTNRCRWRDQCSGGCPQHRRSAHATAQGHEDVAGDNPYCECMSGLAGGHAALWRHIVSALEEQFLHG